MSDYNTVKEDKPFNDEGEMAEENWNEPEKIEEPKKDTPRDPEYVARTQGEQKPKASKASYSKQQDAGFVGGLAEKNDATAALLTETEERGFQDPINLPRDAKLISLLIKAEGILDYEPRIVPQLLEFMHSKIPLFKI